MAATKIVFDVNFEDKGPLSLIVTNVSVQNRRVGINCFKTGCNCSLRVLDKDTRSSSPSSNRKEHKSLQNYFQQ